MNRRSFFARAAALLAGVTATCLGKPELAFGQEEMPAAGESIHGGRFMDPSAVEFCKRPLRYPGADPHDHASPLGRSLVEGLTRLEERKPEIAPDAYDRWNYSLVDAMVFSNQRSYARWENL